MKNVSVGKKVPSDMSSCVAKPLFRTPFQQHVIVDWDSHGV